MTAWQVLIAGSVLVTGNAWQHLNAQQAVTTLVQIFGSIETEIMREDLAVELESSEVEIEVEAEIEVEIESQIEAEI